MKHIESTLTKKQIFLSRIATGAAILLWGVLLLLASTGVLKLSLKSLALPLFFCSLALLFLILAPLQQNTLLLWLFPAALALSAALFLHVYGLISLARLYPIFVACPAVGSFITGCYSGLWKDHLKVIALFGPSAVIFCLNALAGCSLGATIAAFLMFLGAAAICYTVLNRNKIKENKNGDAND